MSLKISEESLYRPIADVLRAHGVKRVEEAAVNDVPPDLLATMGGCRFVIEVKIGGEPRLLEDIPRAFAKAVRADAQGAISLLFPSRVREARPDLLESLAPRLEIATAVVALPWLVDCLRAATLDDLARRIESSYESYLETRRPAVNCDVVIGVSREAVDEIASSIRRDLVSKYLDDAVAIVGRFDVYRAELEDLGVGKDEIKAWIAYIAAYLAVNQILFYHMLSQRTGRYRPLPDADPFLPDMDLLRQLRELFSKAAAEYEPIFGPDLLSIIEKSGGLRSVSAVVRYITALKALKPEHLEEELLGRLYQESIPPEARKKLGAFFTKPKAAAMLAALAIDRWDEKVLDPACGSGTLLTEAYRRKRELAPDELRRNRRELHRRLLSDVWGIDVMPFARYMTSLSLLAQDPAVPAKLDNVRAGDGLESMVLPDSAIQPGGRAGEPSRLPREAFDVVMMNPPFTRRERLSEVGEIRRVKSLFERGFEGEVIRGRTGYWAYFVAAADNVLKQGGRLAVVTPEEFFAGRSAESLRRFLFLGEVYDPSRREYVRARSRRYAIEYLVRSGAEVAFSEGASYRDYLVVLRKCGSGESAEPAVLVVLRKPLDEINARAIALNVREFSRAPQAELSTEEFVAIKLYNVGEFIAKHVGNIKPIVGFNTVRAQRLFFKLIEALAKHPTLGDLESSGALRIRVYNPGQYSKKGVEDEARKLFVKRYAGRGKALFEYAGESGGKIRLSITGIEGEFEVSPSDTVPALRTYAGVRKIDISNEEECAIVNLQSIPADIRRTAGVDGVSCTEAAEDIKSAYEDLAGEVLLVRKVRLTSPRLCWLAFHTSNRALGITSALLNLRATSGAELIALYLNSSLALLQLLGFAVEVQGAYLTLHGGRVWKHLHVPDFGRLPEDVRDRALNLFERIGRVNADSLFERVRKRDPIQREIDEVSLEMLGLKGWRGELDEIYDALAEELSAMHEILKRSEKTSRRAVGRKSS